jgi:hypothetical protein
LLYKNNGKIYERERETGTFLLLKDFPVELTHKLANEVQQLFDKAEVKYQSLVEKKNDWWKIRCFLAQVRLTQRAPRQTPPGRKEPDGWDSPRFWEVVVSYGSLPFPVLVLPSRHH